VGSDGARARGFDDFTATPADRLIEKGVPDNGSGRIRHEYYTAPSRSRATSADDLRANLIGLWTLQSYESSSVNGSDMSYPRTTARQ
jgi:hypothetical protein